MPPYVGEYRQGDQIKTVEGETFNQVLSRLSDLIHPTPEQHEKLRKFNYVSLPNGCAAISFDHLHYELKFTDGEMEQSANSCFR